MASIRTKNGNTNHVEDPADRITYRSIHIREEERAKKGGKRYSQTETLLRGNSVDTPRAKRL